MQVYGFIFNDKELTSILLGLTYFINNMQDIIIDEQKKLNNYSKNKNKQKGGKEDCLNTMKICTEKVNGLENIKERIKEVMYVYDDDEE